MSAFAAHFLIELKPEQVQLDELYTPLAQLLETDPNLEEFSGGSSWVWTAMNPVSKLLIVMMVGDRSLAVAQAVVHQVKQRLAVDCLPVFLTDGLAHYKTALDSGCLLLLWHRLGPPPNCAGFPYPAYCMLK